MKISEIFGVNTFSLAVMHEKLPRDVYHKLLETINSGKPLDLSIAETVAQAMKEWAMGRGATHFTHWFQPLSRGTAEKHDSFLSQESLNGNGRIIERFNKNQLVQAEPDASSFPSGGMRSTFEARGYTAWDPTSPVFLMENDNGATLCIPSVYLSYTGEALDKKTPLLRSIEVLEKAVIQLLNLLDIPAKGVYPTLGPEQEYFLIDKEHFEARPDLRLTGRTLIGRPSPRGQKLEDHYFGTIQDQVLSFMQELEKEAYKLGIPLATRHNEVAPSQFELAPIFDHANIVNDQNKLLMEIMPKIARKHNLECLLHEKPFKGLNGSGKHNNWSLMTKEGKNLLEPGENSEEQLLFLLFITIIVRAVYKRSNLLRASVAIPGNDFRLGGNEAPPAIISVFLGNRITDILENISKGSFLDMSTNVSDINLGLKQLPAVARDNSDRNRTSPFAFTGNKFEFRAVGASQSLGFPNTFINTIVAEQLLETTSKITEKLNSGLTKKKAILSTIKEHYLSSKQIIFNGNNYSKEWIHEAEKRGLPNFSNSFEALQVLLDDENQELLKRLGILTKRELKARYTIDIAHLRRIVEIEANTLLHMINSGVFPGILRFLHDVGATTLIKPTVIAESKAYTKITSRIIGLLDELYDYVGNLEKLLAEYNAIPEDSLAASFGIKKIRPSMESVREVSDQLEGYIPQDFWPYPSYIDILHTK